MKDVAVILINYNSSNHSINCLKSIYEKTSDAISFEVIITDNNSEITDFQNLEKQLRLHNFPNLTLIRNTTNTGFGGGNMTGFEKSNAKYICFLNNDTILLNDCLSILKNYLDEHPQVGIAGAQAYTADGSFLISLDHFASPTREILGRKFLELSNSKKYPKRKKLYSKPLQVNFVPGSLLFLKTEDFLQSGGFDTNIFLYYEETDLCIRLLKIGKPAYLVPDAKFMHFHGGSTERSLAIKKELKISLLYVINKHYGKFSRQIVLLFLIQKYFFSSIFKSKNRPILALLLKGAPITESMKYKQ
ncbi:glycosyltransferase family 2 protein [Flavobacterium aurantiibacter]|uniref:Glycosyl transferase family 2 n=1 Tax=Flavobacterium aurantiibacter TaxID=2023067 RepID=A0A256A178_9FLAO|nr:glycosyltransferase family 2 protein [Flavobacterium aurantiibacter]OYQ47442.1 glycosyl transferase family 2 [Flavobacterium aurantiibacter]